MAAEVVHHNEIAGVQGGSQKRFAESGEANTIHRTVEYHCSTCSIQSDRMYKRAGLPTSRGNRLDKSFTTERPSSKTSEVCLQAGFIKKYELFRVYARLTLEPVGTFESDIFAILLCRPLRFFLKLAFSRFNDTQTVLTEHVRPSASLRSCSVASGHSRRLFSRAFSVPPVIARLRPQRS